MKKKNVELFHTQTCSSVCDLSICCLTDASSSFSFSNSRSSSLSWPIKAVSLVTVTSWFLSCSLFNSLARLDIWRQKLPMVACVE